MQAPTAADGAFEHRLDGAHNHTQRAQRAQEPGAAPPTLTYSYDEADRLTAAGAAAVTVDASGNTTRQPGGAFDEPFVYDQAKRLVQATIVDGGAGVPTPFTYDGGDTFRYLDGQIGVAADVTPVAHFRLPRTN